MIFLDDRVQKIRWGKMEENNYDPRVFRVKDPPCVKCHDSMDFIFYANFNGSGLDWLQFYCKNSNCGYFFNVELLWIAPIRIQMHFFDYDTAMDVLPFSVFPHDLIGKCFYAFERWMVFHKESGICFEKSVISRRGIAFLVCWRSRVY